MNRIVNSALVAIILFVLGVGANAAFYNIENATIPNLPAEWSGGEWETVTVGAESGVQPPRGSRVLVLTGNSEEAWLLTPDIVTVTNTVIDFGFRLTNSSSVATLHVARVSSGLTNYLGSAALAPSGSSWQRRTFFPNPQLTAGETNRYLFTVDGITSGEILQLDNLYVGRGLIREGGAFSYTYATNSGIPDMWFKWSTVDWIQGTITSVPVFRAQTGAQAGQVSGFLSAYAALPELESGNLVLSVDMYNTLYTSGNPTGRNDWVQFRVTTNDWASSFTVGDPVYRYDPAFPDETWRTVQVMGFVEEVQGQKNVRLGMEAVSAPGASGKNIFLNNITLELLTSVAISDLHYADWDDETETLSNWGASAFDVQYNDNPYIAVSVNPRPPDDVTNAVVYLINDRVSRGVVETNTLVQVGESDIWRTEWPVGPFEAGETNRYRIVCEFSSLSGSPTSSPVFFPGPTEGEWLAIGVSGKGSVWINELAADWIELAASEGRTIPADIATNWTIRFASGEDQIIYEVPSIAFTQNLHHGIAFSDFDLTPVLAGSFLEGQVYLVNAAGVEEFSVPYNLTVSDAWSAQGNGPFVGEDYSSYGTNFTWTGTDGNRGEINEGQGIELPVEVSFQITGTVSFASCDISVFFTRGAILTNILANVDGDSQVVTLSGVHASTSHVLAVVSGQAFGWLAQSSTNQLSMNVVPNQMALPMVSSIGTDSFLETSFMPYWERLIDVGGPDWPVNQPAGYARCSTGSVIPPNQTSRIRVRNDMTSRGKGHLRVRLETQNTFPVEDRIDRILPTVSTNATWGVGSIISHPPVLNRYSNYDTDDWVLYDSVVPLIELMSPNYWFSLNAINAGASGKNMFLRNLRVAFQDMVTSENLFLLPSAPVHGETVGVRVDLNPWGESISNVTASVIYKHNDTWYTNSQLIPDPITLTNAVTVSLSNAMGPFGEGDAVEYYVAVTYDPDDGDPDTDLETRYFPDNSTISNGSWLVIGPYAPVPVEAVAFGLKNIWINEIYPNGDGTNDFIELMGTINLSLAGWKLEIYDLDDGDANPDIYTMPGGAALTNSPVNSRAFYVLGGADVGVRNLSLTNGLPAAGGLILRDNAGRVRYAVSYAADGEEVDDARFIHLGDAEGSSLVATGAGNPANQEFVWESQTASPAAANPTQVTANSPPAAPAFLDRENWGFTVTSMTARVDEVFDIDTPVEYRLWIDGEGNSDWSGSREYTFAGLDENTQYTIQTTARDSLGAVSDTNSVAYYTLLDTPAAPTVTALGTDELQVTGTVTNLNVGDTRIHFYREDSLGSSGWLSVGEWPFDGLDPNTEYSFTVRARNGDGIETGFSATNSAFTLAQAPTVPPDLVQEGSVLRLSVESAYDGATMTDGNPDYTEYAVMTYVPDAGTTNYVGTNGVVSGTVTWASLPIWANEAGEDGLVVEVNILETNIFYFVARNGNGIETVAGPEVESVFEIQLAAYADQILDGEGHVEVMVEVSNPFTNALVNARLQYGVSAETWSNATILNIEAAYGTPGLELDYEILDLPTDENYTNSVVAAWDARGDLGSVTTNVFLRWLVEDPSDEKSTEIVFPPGGLDLDLEPPTGVITRLDANPTNAPTLRFRVVFSEDMAVFDPASVTKHEDGVTGTINSVTGGGSVYTVTVTSVTGNGTFGISVAPNAVTDEAGNRNVEVARVDYDIDQTAPTGIITRLDANPTNAPTLHFRVAFDEDVSGFTMASVTKHEDGVTGTIDSLTGGGSVYTVTVTSVTGDGTFGISVAADEVVDHVGNGNEAVARVDYTIDQTDPTGVIERLDANPTNATLLHFRVTFNESIYGFTTHRVSKYEDGVTGTIDSVTGGGSVYTVTVTSVTGDGTFGISVAADEVSDAAGNMNVAVAQVDYTVDQTPPAIHAVSPPSDPTNTNPVPFAVAFSEPVNGFAADDISAVGGAITSVTPIGGAPSDQWTVSVTPNDPYIQVCLTNIMVGAVTDIAGNGNVLGWSGNGCVQFDSIAPTGTITRLDASPTNAETLRFYVEFTEGVVGFDEDAITLHVVGVAGDVAVAGAGTTYTVTVSNVSGTGFLGISVEGGAVRDEAGNDNERLAQVDYNVDQTPPVPGSAEIGGGADSVILSAASNTLSFTWSGFSDTGNVESAVSGYYYGLLNNAGTTNGIFTTNESAIFTNPPRGAVTGYVWAVDNVGNIGTETASDEITIYYVATAFAVTGMPAQVAGEVQVIGVHALIAALEPDIALAYTGRQSVVFSGASASLSGAVPTVTDADGIAVAFGDALELNFTLGQAISTMRLVRAESGMLIGVEEEVGSVTADGNELEVTVTPANKARLFFGQAPQTPVVAGVAWPSFTVDITDAFGNKTGGDTDAITVQVAPGVFAGGTNTVVAVNSSATFTGLVYTTASAVEVSARAAGLLTSPTNVVTITPAAAAYYQLQGPSPVVAGSTNALTILARDAFGNLDTNYHDMANLVFSGSNPSPKGILPQVDQTDFGSDTSVAFDHGEGTGNLVLYRTGASHLRATNVLAEIGSPTSLVVTVTLAAGRELDWEVTPPASVPVSTFWAVNPKARYQDQFGNLDTEATGWGLMSDTKGVAATQASITGTGGVLTFGALNLPVGIYRIVVQYALIDTPPFEYTYVYDPNPPDSKILFWGEFNGSGFVLHNTDLVGPGNPHPFVIEWTDDLVAGEWSTAGIDFDIEVFPTMNPGDPSWRIEVEFDNEIAGPYFRIRALEE
jgi:hypothetical protein